MYPPLKNLITPTLPSPQPLTLVTPFLYHEIFFFFQVCPFILQDSFSSTPPNLVDNLGSVFGPKRDSLAYVVPPPWAFNLFPHCGSFFPPSRTGLPNPCQHQLCCPPVGPPTQSLVSFSGPFFSPAPFCYSSFFLFPVHPLDFERTSELLFITSSFFYREPLYPLPPPGSFCFFFRLYVGLVSTSPTSRTNYYHFPSKDRPFKFRGEAPFTFFFSPHVDAEWEVMTLWPFLRVFPSHCPFCCKVFFLPKFVILGPPPCSRFSVGPVIASNLFFFPELSLPCLQQMSASLYPPLASLGPNRCYRPFSLTFFPLLRSNVVPGSLSKVSFTFLPVVMGFPQVPPHFSPLYTFLRAFCASPAPWPSVFPTLDYLCQPHPFLCGGFFFFPLFYLSPSIGPPHPGLLFLFNFFFSPRSGSYW